MKDFRVTPQVLRRIRMLARQRLSLQYISSRVGCRSVAQLISIARQHQIDLNVQAPEPEDIATPPRPKPDRRIDPTRRRANGAVITLHVAPSIVETFEREAARRGSTAEMVAAKCIELIAGDDLFTAVLDG
jgi:hypothetical protein